VTFTEKALKKEIETKTAWWIFRSGAFDKEVSEGDVARLQNFHRDQGFLDATVSYRTSISDDGHDMTVIFTVQEGTRYRIEDIQFRGHTVFSADELLNMMKSLAGEIVKRPQVDADVRAIQDRYGELGYIYSKVHPTRVFSDTPGFVRLMIDIEEGDQFRVGRVAVRGNARTKDKVVRRALNLYPPDDLFNLTEAKEAEKRLVETRIFSSARVIPVGDQPGVRDAVIDVVEAEKAGDFLFGVGVTSNSGLVGSIVLDLQNFDLFDTPRSWAEFFKLKSFYGGGQRMRIELQPGTEVNRFRIDFTEPYLFDKPLRYDVSLFLFERDRDSYHESRVGTTNSLGKRFASGPLQGWSGEIAFRNELVDIDDVDIFAASEIRDDEGNNLITGIKGTLVRDRTDNRFVPTVGDRLRINYEQVGLLGGDHMFGRLGLAYNWYKTLAVDRQERKRVLALRGEGGMIVGDAPVFERFYAGGIGSMRGFAYRGVGEREGIDDNNIGGDYLLLGGAEYSYPIYGENLRGHVFLDTGTAGSGAYRAAVGTGVRFTLNIFGPIPLELNLAMPVAKGDGDDDQIFSFSIGSLF
jgi:outer membrane protein insertion porin family